MLALLALLGGCARPRVEAPPRRPAEVRAQIVRMLPADTADRGGWATDVYAAFAALDIPPTDSNLCAALAVTAQESSFHAEPQVPGLARIARKEIDRRAAQHHIPGFLVRAALALDSPGGKSYGERLAAVRTERELSRLYEDFIGMVPLGRRLLGDGNPVHTGGPMQVSVAFAEDYANDHAYPYPVDGSIRHEVFSRRGGMYFGIAHLLGYPADYPRMLYRFADFNAGWYASRNAAFQNAVSVASGIPLDFDGDLLRYDGGVGATERAVRTLVGRLDLDEGDIHDALAQGESPDFARTDLYARVFELAEATARKPLPRAMLPRIRLESPKITRKLTTAWFAKRVDGRYQRCLKLASRHRH
ncbi:DUF1615 domain-containing protein [Frateuria sp. STR12]|uniref:DUF1615 domain-containing protein n=1 Tax=Frateuria hangzhouensis TaxID=2995589 RepID=UPI002260C91A|nr:DUF1615 domain-containing protein [Frateuria sp. STR12]MCX7514873.1 DUF1615 domain-containing protein [Frateuria sp. STR12]